MKKTLLITLLLVSIFLFTGCDTMNTPTKRTEEYLSRYVSLNDDVKGDIDLMVETESLNEANSKIYKDVIERQLTNLKYEIVSEEVNGDKATVTAKITVYDLVKSRGESKTYYTENPNDFYTDNALDKDKYSKYELDEMLKYSKTVDYTIEFNLTKVDDVWTVDEVGNTTKEKIYGLYDYGNNK